MKSSQKPTKLHLLKNIIIKNDINVEDFIRSKAYVQRKEVYSEMCMLLNTSSSLENRYKLYLYFCRNIKRIPLNKFTNDKKLQVTPINNNNNDKIVEITNNDKNNRPLPLRDESRETDSDRSIQNFDLQINRKLWIKLQPRLHKPCVPYSKNPFVDVFHHE